MRILLDENLPVRLAAALRDLGHDVEHVSLRALSGAIDEDVRALSDREERVLVTQDIEFADARMFRPGEHSGIVLVRLRRAAKRLVFERMLEVFRAEDVETWSRCFVVVSDTRVRVRRPEH
jgi:predicted nuclease of predicted toxin-antitoxin system